MSDFWYYFSNLEHFLQHQISDTIFLTEFLYTVSSTWIIFPDPEVFIFTTFPTLKIFSNSKFLVLFFQLGNFLRRQIFNVNSFLKSVSTSKSRETYDLDTDRVTYDLHTETTTHKINGVVGAPSTLLRLYLPPFQNLIFRCSWKRIHVNRPCPDTDSRIFLSWKTFCDTKFFILFFCS